MLGTFTAVCTGALWPEHHSAGESQAGTILNPSLRGPPSALGSSHPLSTCPPQLNG